MREAVRVYATELVSSLGLATPIDLSRAARSLGLEIECQDVTGFEGALVCSKKNRVGTIVVKSSTKPPERQRFTIAHEIAHYALPHHCQAAMLCGSETVESWAKIMPEQELEANTFASEFLMPTNFISRDWLHRAPCFDVIRTMAGTFSTSLTASAYRLMELTSFPAAIVLSKEGVIRWFKASDEFANFVPVKDDVSNETYAFDCFSGKTVPDKLSPVKAEAWIRAEDLRSTQFIQEHSIWLPAYASVLSLLYIDRPLERTRPDDDTLLEELDPDEFTLNRRRWPR